MDPDPVSSPSSCREAVSRERRSKALVEVALAAEGLAAGMWRSVPVEPDVLGPTAAEARPTIAQLFVPRPSRVTDAAFEGALVRARRRMERSARSDGVVDFAVASASARTIVYKGLVAGGRLAEFYPDLARPLADQPRHLPPAVCHEHDADVVPGPTVPAAGAQR